MATSMVLVAGTIQSRERSRSGNACLACNVLGSASVKSLANQSVTAMPSSRLVARRDANSARAANRLRPVLVLSRDANGQGSVSTNGSVYKSVLLVDLNVGNATNIAGTGRDNAGGLVTTSPGVLDPQITPLSSVEAINMLNAAQLSKFNINLDQGGTNQVTKLTLGEKWEGMSLVSANDPAAPNDYFLFIANDNDFLTNQGKMIGPDGTLIDYNAFAAHPASRVPTGPAGAATVENDTMFLAYRVTIVPEPTSAVIALCVVAASMRRRRQVR